MFSPSARSDSENFCVPVFVVDHAQIHVPPAPVDVDTVDITVHKRGAAATAKVCAAARRQVRRPVRLRRA